jgi:hypothetical protein
MYKGIDRNQEKYGSNQLKDFMFKCVTLGSQRSRKESLKEKEENRINIS